MNLTTVYFVWRFNNARKVISNFGDADTMAARHYITALSKCRKYHGCDLLSGSVVLECNTTQDTGELTVIGVIPCQP